MRYDKRVVFKIVTEGTYNDSTGNYDNPVTTEYPVLAHVSEMIAYSENGFTIGTDGEGVRKIRIQNPLKANVTEVVVDGKVYVIKRVRKDRKFFLALEVVR